MLTEKVDAELLRAAGPQLKIVANFAVGTDNIDMAAAMRAGVVVANTPNVLNQAVAEHTMALIFAITKRVVETDGYARRGLYQGWGPLLWLGTELRGKTLGIIGTGRIGSAVAQMAAHGCGMKILYTDVARNKKIEKETSAKFVSQRELLKQSDVISLHVPLLPTTHHLMGAQQFRQMKRTAYLINTSRGPVIDERALAIALAKKIIAGAGLDVHEHEPKIFPAFKKLSNIVLTPHTASATHEARNAMSELCAKNVVAVLQEKPAITPVSPA